MATIAIPRRWQNIRERIDSKVIILGVAVLLVAYLVLVPVAMLLWGSLRTAGPGSPGTFTLEHYLKVYADRTTYLLLADTLIYAGGSCALALFIGTSLAWIVERTNVPFRSVLYALPMVMLIMPGVLTGIAWQLLLSPRIGIINVMLKGLLGLKDAPFSIYTMGGMIWLEGLAMSTLVFILMTAAFQTMDPSLEEAATISGAGPLATLRRITLRIMLPALLSIGLIIAVRALESFETPLLVGVPGGILVLTTKIYLAVRQYPANFGLGGTLSVMLMIVSIVGVYFYNRLTTRAERFTTITGKGYRPKIIDLGHWRWAALAYVLLYAVICLGLPLLVLFWGSLLPYYSAPSMERLSDLTLNNYREALDYPGVGKAIVNTVIIASAVGAITMLLTAMISWIVVRTKIRGRQFLDMMTFLPITFPSIVLAISLMWVYLTLPFPVYGTMLILMIAFVTRFMPYGIRAASGSMIQIHKELEEAAGISGASWLQTFVRVTLPLLWPGMLAGLVYIVLLSARELSVAIMLYSPKSLVMSVIIFDIWEGGYPQLVSALGVMMVAALGVVVVLLHRLGGRRVTG